MLAPLPDQIRRIAYLGTPEIAVRPLQALQAAGYEIPVVVSRPDKRRGRRGEPEPSPVKAAAIDLGLPVSEDVDALLGADVDLAVVVAFGRLIQPHVLAEVPMVNIHYSLLPRWRGAAPLERALLAGDDRTGVCLMRVEEGLDTGDVFGCREATIAPTDTIGDLRDRLVALSIDLLIDSLSAGLGEPTPQQGEPVHADKISAEDRHLDWIRPAHQLDRVVRLGGAWTTFRNKRLKIVEAPIAAVDPQLEPGELSGRYVGSGAGALELVEVQSEGKRVQAADDWLNGARPTADDRLGS